MPPMLLTTNVRPQSIDTLATANAATPRASPRDHRRFIALHNLTMRPHSRRTFPYRPSIENASRTFPGIPPTKA